jgi:hypothetical protein
MLHLRYSELNGDQRGGYCRLKGMIPFVALVFTLVVAACSDSTTTTPSQHVSDEFGAVAPSVSTAGAGTAKAIGFEVRTTGRLWGGDVMGPTRSTSRAVEHVQSEDDEVLLRYTFPSPRNPLGDEYPIPPHLDIARIDFSSSSFELWDREGNRIEVPDLSGDLDDLTGEGSPSIGVDRARDASTPTTSRPRSTAAERMKYREALLAPSEEGGTHMLAQLRSRYTEIPSQDGMIRFVDGDRVELLFDPSIPALVETTVRFEDGRVSRTSNRYQVDSRGAVRMERAVVQDFASDGSLRRTTVTTPSGVTSAANGGVR